MKIKCDDCGTIRHDVSYCLQCQKPHCVTCQRKHSRINSDHVFKLPVFDNRKPTCEVHYYDMYKHFISYCTNCKTMVCVNCVEDGHHLHNVITLRTVYDEQKKHATAMKTKVNEQLKEIRYEIDKREKKVTHFKKEFKDLVNKFPYNSRYSLGDKEYAVRDTRYRFENIETNPPQHFETILKQMCTLRAAEYCYQEMQERLGILLLIFKEAEFISVFSQYQYVVEKYVSTPAMCDEDPEINLFCETNNDVKTDYPFFCILIGKKDKSDTEPTKEATLMKNATEQEKEKLETEHYLKRVEAQKLNEISTTHSARSSLTQTVSDVRQGEQFPKTEHYSTHVEAQ